MRYVLFQLTPVWGNDRAVIVTHTRGLELGVFDPQANRVTPDNFGVKFFLFNAGRLQTITAEDDKHDCFIHGMINCHPGSPCESGYPVPGFRLHPGFYQYGLSLPFHRRTALNPPPCPEHVFGPRDRCCGNPCKSPDGWTRSRQTPLGGWPRSDDRQI